jgi:predicted nuclease of restriction endonuclease-like (RecB) superfamily
MPPKKLPVVKALATPDDRGYPAVLAAAKAAIQSARTRAVLAVNAELLGFYWDLGQLIIDRQTAEGYGTKVVERLSVDLRREFESMRGLSPGNLHYMRRLAVAWPDREVCLRVVGKVPWGHNQTLLDKLGDAELRVWYAGQAIEFGWSRAVLEHQIMSGLHRRAGAAPSNFARLLPVGDSELVQQITKDPYNLEFLTLERDAAERTLEAALVTHVQQFLLELGHGFAFVGRQYRLDVDGDELFIDLLMFHIPTVRYVVIELKTQKLTGGDIGQLNLYVAAVDDMLRLPGHNETVGLLLCTAKNDRIVRYALGRSTSPMAVSGYRYTELPETEQQVLPGETELVELVEAAVHDFDAAHRDQS